MELEVEAWRKRAKWLADVNQRLVIPQKMPCQLFIKDACE